MYQCEHCNASLMSAEDQPVTLHAGFVAYLCHTCCREWQLLLEQKPVWDEYLAARALRDATECLFTGAGYKLKTDHERDNLLGYVMSKFIKADKDGTKARIKVKRMAKRWIEKGTTA